LKRNNKVFIALKPLSFRDKHYSSKFPIYKEAIQSYLRMYKRHGALWIKIKFYYTGPCNADPDNLAKPVLDALSGMWYYDDRQIKHMLVQIKEYHHRYGLFLWIGNMPPH